MMENEERAPEQSGETVGTFWSLRLYVAGQTPKSLEAFANLKKICEEYLQGRCEIEVVDLLENPHLAREDQIVAIPTLIRKLPQPIKKIIGTLVDTERVLVGLDIQAGSGKRMHDSGVGHGTTFFVVMSFQKEILAKKATAKVAPEILSCNSGVFKVLVVEDEDLNRLVAKIFLQKLGHDVETANDGSEAFKRIEANNFDLVFMDIQMPTMDGITATKLIRNSLELKAKANIPIIAMTAHAMSGDRDHFLAAGMNDYVSKPIELQALKDVIVRVMSTAS